MSGTPAPRWEPGPQRVVGQPGEVHIWLAALDQLPGEGPELLAGLPASEIERARSAGSGGFRERFARSRYALRDLLSRYLGEPPTGIPLDLGTRGRPSLAGQHAGRLDFNLSHTEDIALFVFGWNCRVGVDVEGLHRPIDWRAISRRSFSLAERAELERTPDADRQRAFLRGWTRKEAYTKARGEGFAYGFQRFSVSLLPEPEGRGLLTDELDPQAVHRWWIRDIDLQLPCVASIAGEGDPPILRAWRYSPADR